MNPQPDYTPRPGSHVHNALQLLLDGPATTERLGAILKCPANNVSSRLYGPLSAGMIIRVIDKAGISHYARVDVPYDQEQFDKPETTKSAGPDPADPFGLVARKHSAQSHAAQSPKSLSPDIGPMARAPQDSFAAALFSNGILLIQADGQEVRLTPRHRAQLYVYLSQFRESDAIIAANGSKVLV